LRKLATLLALNGPSGCAWASPMRRAMHVVSLSELTALSQ
jgi:hypothetical protein